MFDLGFDIGGTNIAAGLVNEAQQITERISVPFPKGNSGEQVAQLMQRMACDLLEKANADMSQLSSVGAAVPGSLDECEAVVINAYNLGFHDIKLKALLQKEFPDIPVFLVNDANAAALAELHRGAFLGAKTAVLLTLGTGVGGGLILAGRMFNGGNNSGVELGHMLLKYGEKACTCGQNGCVEAYCAATWLVEQGRSAAIAGSAMLKRAGGRLERVNAKTVIDCARAGDEIAQRIFDTYVDNLGSALASIVNLLDPEVIALGGGVGQAGEFLLKPLRENMGSKCFFEYRGRVVPAEMGNDAGIVGAAMMRVNSAQN